MTQEEKLQEAANTQTKIRAVVVAAEILTESEAEKYIYVELGSRSQLPPEAVPEQCCSGCGHDMQDAIILRIGISTSIGDHKRDTILQLLESSSMEN